MTAIPTHISCYEIVQKIGSGGMGSLYLARDLAIDRQVAIKVMISADDAVREQFTREAQVIRGLIHPNIVTIYDVGEQDELAFIVMEYIRGETLAEAAAHQTSLGVGARLAIVEGICAGLAYAHQCGVVHRDVKPANVMMTVDGKVKVIDFGIASVAHAKSGLTQSSGIFGTLNYISPEMLKGEMVDHRADIFAVGAIVYELMSRRMLFPGSVSDGLIQRVLAGTHKRLSAVVPGVPPRLDRIIERSIATDPSARYQDLVEMAHDIARCRTELCTAGCSM